MKQVLRPTLGQHLVLTPQLQQAIRLLQLSAVELDTEIAAALESNPLLDLAEDAPASDGATSDDPLAAPLDANHDDGTRVDDAGQPDGGDARGGADDAAARDDRTLDTDGDWYQSGDGAGATHAGNGNGNDTDWDGESITAAAPEDLHDHLLWQLHLGRFSPRERGIGVALIEAIGPDGYLGEPIDAIRAALRPEIDADTEQVVAVLRRIQHFDPLGVGARDLAECLAIQLATLAADTPGLALAQRIATGHLELLARHGADRLGAALGCPAADAAAAIALLRSLDPRPGTRIDPSPPEFIAPDCVAFRSGGVWRVALAGGQPRLLINNHYEQLIARSAGADASYLRGQLQEARWLIHSLETRADTILRVARTIVRHQAGFLEHGAAAMRPLTLREVAEVLELHESTISRATARKYLLTPRGTFEFRHFFASGVDTGDGGSASSTAIQAMMKRLLADEDPQRPYSDARLAGLLKAEGVPVARRTVAKYREAMNIPASNERQRRN